MLDRALLNKCTSSDSNPTPGYLLPAVAAMLQRSPSSGVDVPSSACAYLLNTRYAKSSVYAKLKTIKLVCYLVNSGNCQHFNQACIAHVDKVRDAAEFRGPLDPVRGDSVNNQLREAAKECLQAIYDGGNDRGKVSGGKDAPMHANDARCNPGRKKSFPHFLLFPGRACAPAHSAAPPRDSSLLVLAS